MTEMMRMKHWVQPSFSLFHKDDKNVVKHTVGFGHETLPLLPDWDMTTDITFLLALDSERVETSLDPCVLDRSFKMERGEI